MRGYLVASLIAAAVGCGCGSSSSDAPVTVDESPGALPSTADASTSPAADAGGSETAPAPTDATSADSMSADTMADTMNGTAMADAGASETAATPADSGVAPAVDAGASPPACGAPPAEPPSLPVAAPPGGTPMIAHWEKPVAGNVVALTFDDGPNPATTNSILDTLKANGIRATFFLNSRVRSDLRTDAAAKATIVRIISEGHVIGNHTAHHLDLSKESAASIESELKMLEDDLAASVPCAPHLSLVRAPFGEPYLSGSDAAQKLVYPIVWKHGVHIGWSIESLDYTCPATNTACVVDRVMERIDAGRRGPILMHDTEPVTAAALPTLIAELKKRGVTFVTAEKLVRDKYGKPSADLVAK